MSTSMTMGSVLTQQIRDRMVLIQSHQLLPIAQGATDQKALHMVEPARVLHLPDCLADGHDVEAQKALQKPDEAVILIALGECFHMVVLRASRLTRQSTLAAGRR